jgi:hypothetical protein
MKNGVRSALTLYPPKPQRNLAVVNQDGDEDVALQTVIGFFQNPIGLHRLGGPDN